MSASEFLKRASGQWGWILFRGIVAILFGIVAVMMPGITLATLTLLWGAYALVEGVFSLIAAFRIHDQGRPFWPLLLVGIAGIGAGVVTFLWPGLTALTLLMVIAAWAVVIGIFQIVAAIRLRKEIHGEFWLVLSGLLSVAFGAFVAMFPGAGALGVIWMIAAFSIAFGVVLVALALRLKGFIGKLEGLAHGTA